MITLNKWTWIRQAKNNYLRSRQFLGMHIPFDQVEYRHYPAVWYLVDYVLYSTIGIYRIYTDRYRYTYSIVLQYGVLRVPGTPSTPSTIYRVLLYTYLNSRVRRTRQFQTIRQSGR